MRQLEWEALERQHALAARESAWRATQVQGAVEGIVRALERVAAAATTAYVTNRGGGNDGERATSGQGSTVYTLI